MRGVLLGILVGLGAAILFSLLASLVICLGASPMLFERLDGTGPLLGILAGAFVAGRKGSWTSGAGVGLVFVGLWLAFWMYAMGRGNPLLWIEEGLPRLTLAHAGWWAAAILVGMAGGLLRRMPVGAFTVSWVALAAGAFIWAFAALRLEPDAASHGIAQTSTVGRATWVRGDGNGVSTEEKLGPEADGTLGFFRTFPFGPSSRLNVGVNDCDSDDALPFDDSNTTYLGQDLAGLVEKLNFQAAASRREILCVINGGFFGASWLSVAHHEEPLVEDGRALYEVDLLRPRDQAWFLAVNSPNAVMAGKPRFSMRASIPWTELADYQTVLGGVRPLRFEGKSLELKPGAGVTGLKCSRTSVGWNADGSEFYVLTIFDPDGEMASELQRKAGAEQTGGWDVAQVQKFWEERGVPFALLFDGGESTQRAVRRADGGYDYVPSGYQYSFTLGYLRSRPLRITLPILPPAEAHRGVLNYLYVDGPADGTTRS